MKNIVGIDIGSYLTKVVEAVPAHGGYELVTLKYFRTPFVKDTDVHFDNLFKQLESIIPLQRLRTSEIGVSLPTASVNFVHFDFPKLAKNELARALPVEARKKILPAPAPQDTVNYIILSEHKVKEDTQLRVFAGAAEKVVLDKYYAAFKSKGVTLHFVAAPEISLYAAFLECFAGPGAKNLAVINIGFKNTTIALFIKGAIAFVRNIPFAGNDVIQSVVKQMKIDPDQVLQLLSKNEIPEAILSTGWTYLLSEIRRSFAFYKSIAPSEDVAAIQLGGGLLKSASLINFLKSNLRGEVGWFHLETCKKISVKKTLTEEAASASPLFLIGFGLICGLMTPVPLINFLPAEAIQKKKAQQFDILFLRILVVSSVFLLIAVVISNVMLMRANTRAFPPARQEFLKSKHDALNKKLTEVRSRQKGFTQQIAFVDSVKQFQFSPDSIIKVFSEVLPDSLYIQKLYIYLDTTKGQKPATLFTMEGKVFADFERASSDLEKFVESLKASKKLSDIKASRLTLENLELDPTAKSVRLTAVKERVFTIEGAVVRE